MADAAVEEIGAGARRRRSVTVVVMLVASCTMFLGLWSYLRTEIALAAPRGMIEPSPDQVARAPEATSA